MNNEFSTLFQMQIYNLSPYSRCRHIVVVSDYMATGYNVAPYELLPYNRCRHIVMESIDHLGFSHTAESYPLSNIHDNNYNNSTKYNSSFPMKVPRQDVFLTIAYCCIVVV